jgi:hypothetical protein
MDLKLNRTKPGTKQRRTRMRMVNSGQWQAICRLKDEQVGQWSDVASLSVMG